MGPRFNKPLYNEVLNITNDILQLGKITSQMSVTEPRYNEPRYNEILDRTNTIRLPRRQNLPRYRINMHATITKDECRTDQQSPPFGREVEGGKSRVEGRG